HPEKLHTREPGDLGDACDESSSQDGGRRLRPHGPRVRLRGVTQQHSTDESFEQRRNIVGGEGGGKAADQGEHSSIRHVPDTERVCACPTGGRVYGQGCPLGRYLSEIRTGCANKRPSGSVRGASGNWCPYRDLIDRVVSAKACLRQVSATILAETQHKSQTSSANALGSDNAN